MNKQRKVLITITYNEMGIIVDTKAEEVAQPSTKDTNIPITDTISRQAAIDEAEEWIEAVYCGHDEQRERDAIKHVINGIKKSPSAQLDIIRCPDCYYNDGTAYCELHFRNVKAKDFCSWAERRE